ncbi:unnamed protein product [Rotaria socialis]|uniref:Uncharacterized protein n=1 Tax=Rotaria socialis TaxID=392032 RepID=A0A819YIR2_9BILA|nr:unnamed protein product [Rotaria socialis]CAF3468006.1 unnamed protein product [Rotaria socialis]CAF4156591.1 unnamed protein product [Rotaria socialis]CAF4192380.1 unnamed protein product [Rotaria socialis]
MPWGYWNWIYCSVLISLGIILITFFILVILLCYCDKVFFSAVAKMFNIQRCIIDIHHTVIRKNSTFNFSRADIIKPVTCFSGILSHCALGTGEAPGGNQPPEENGRQFSENIKLYFVAKLGKLANSTVPLIVDIMKFLNDIKDKIIPTLEHLTSSILLEKDNIPQLFESKENNIIVKLIKLGSSTLLPKTHISESLKEIDKDFHERLQPLTNTKLPAGTTAQTLRKIEDKVRGELTQLAKEILSPINKIIWSLQEIQNNIEAEFTLLTKLIFYPINEIIQLLKEIETKSSTILAQLDSPSLTSIKEIAPLLQIIKNTLAIQLKELINSPVPKEDERKNHIHAFRNNVTKIIIQLAKETQSQRDVIENAFKKADNNISEELRKLTSLILSANRDMSQSVQNTSIEKSFNNELCQLSDSTISAKTKITQALRRIEEDFTRELKELIKSELPQINGIKEFVRDIRNKFSEHLGPLNNIISPLTSKGIKLQYPRSNSEYERPALNMYGRFLSFNKRINKAFLTILTTIIISAALIAAFGNLVLATTTVYRDGPCPTYGPMECYSGDNHTYFECNTGQILNFSVDSASGACFRWIARDMTTADLTTQIGVTAGFLTALGSITECLIRIYLSALNKRLGVSIGIGRILAKTVGINRITATTPCCGRRIRCRCGFFNLSQYKHPHMTVIVTFIYILVPFLIIPGIALLYHFQLTVTLLTFVFLITFALVCVVGLSWIAIQDDETSVNVPGGWDDTIKLCSLLQKQIDPSPQSNSNDAEASTDA